MIALNSEPRDIEAAAERANPLDPPEGKEEEEEEES